ncbi:interleukin-11 receptor subunit alpha [Engraulis encrasicolus]|uniref:interleukin-11 receptor subunit alpha n=1 Tax=Engraulis encrasicolus TaxID=184585 RepID=UPI002FD67D3F
MPGPVSCPGRLIVIGILSLLVVHLSSAAWSNEVSDVQYGRLGSTVTLACRGSRKGFPVEWRVNGSSVVVVEEGAQEGDQEGAQEGAQDGDQAEAQDDSSLSLPDVNSSMEGNYSCHDQQSGALIHALQLRLGNPPSRVNITCWLPNHFRVYCSWTRLADSLLPTHYISSYISAYQSVSEVEECIQEVVGSQKCVVFHPRIWGPRHTVNITEVNPLGMQQTILRVDLQQLLKPDPPEEVVCMSVEGHPTKLLVQWRSPASWNPEDGLQVAFPLEYQLRYRPVGSRFWSTLYIENRTSLMITDALAGHLHHVQVQAREAIDPQTQWSDWSPLIQEQPWTEPESTAEPTTIPFIPEDITVPMRPSKEATPGPPLLGGVVMLMSLFAGIIVVVGVTVGLLLWVRHRRREGWSKQQLSSMVKMKTLLI